MTAIVSPPAMTGIEGAFARIGVGHIVLALALILYPVIASDFFLTQIGAYSLIFGMIGLSLMLLAGYGGMVSLAQISVAGMAGYAVAIFGLNNSGIHGFGWPWWIVVPFAVAIAGVASALIGAISARTDGIYTIMITLAIAAAFFYFARQNYALLNGFNGFNQVLPPELFGVDWRRPVPLYYLTMVFAALAYFTVLYVARTPFGLALQGVRDNPRRMAALGFNVTAHRIAAYAFASFIAAVAGILLVWLNAQVSPGTIAVGPAIDILIIAVIGGLRHPIGPFIGALIFVLLRTFALDFLVMVGIPGERFQLLVGLVFLAIVFWSPDGILGLWPKVVARMRAASSLTGNRDGGV